MIRLAALPCILALAGCTTLTCERLGGAPMLEYELFFGRSNVSDQAWAEFAAQVVTPNLPAGFTELDADGQWLNPDTRLVGRERSKVLIAVLPDNPATASAIAHIKDEYRQRFAQLVVGTVVHPVCGAF
ncbi:MAG TPA: DUF3574 domain-containing protein [Acetobacteraceae bacterium]